MTRSEGELGVPDGDFQIRNGKTWGIYLKTMCFYCDSKHTTYLIFWNFPCLFLVIRVYFLYHSQITHLSNLLYLIITLLSSWHFSSSACMPPSAPPPTSMVYNTYHLHCSFLLLFFAGFTSYYIHFPTGAVFSIGAWAITHSVCSETH